MPQPTGSAVGFRSAATAIALIIGVLLAAAGCVSNDAGDDSAASGGPFRQDPSAAASDAADPTDSPDPLDGDCDGSGQWSCAWIDRFESADTYALLQPGAAGIVVHDRRTGLDWSNANADTSIWAASTIKLAMAADLLERDDDGSIQLTDQDRTWIDDMLLSSDDYAADQLWYAYSGEDDWAFNDDFERMGMTDLQPQPYEEGWPYWGYQMCTARDLVALMNYVLDDLAPPLRDRILPLMRDVDADQQWGVWAAGPAASPGVKDGWTDDYDDLSTVGFVGPDARYTVAIMDDLGGEADFDTGKEIVSQIASLLFDGAF